MSTKDDCSETSPGAPEAGTTKEEEADSSVGSTSVLPSPGTIAQEPEETENPLPEKVVMMDELSFVEAMDDSSAIDSNEESKRNDSSVAAQWKKARCAATGGLVTALGLVLIPAPLPVGAIVTAYGVSILAQEFEGVKEVYDNTKKSLEGSLENLADSLHDKDSEEDGVAQEDKEKKLSVQCNKVECRSEGEAQANETTEAKAAVKEGSTEKDTTSAETTPISEATPNNNDDRHELQDTLGRQEQTFMEGAGKAWKLHTRNVKQVTRRFINSQVLPALRKDSKMEASTSSVSCEATETASIIGNSNENDINVPDSTTSITSSSESSTDDSDEYLQDNGVVIAPEAVAAS